jgi:hypothetical protein
LGMGGAGSVAACDDPTECTLRGRGMVRIMLFRLCGMLLLGERGMAYRGARPVCDRLLPLRLEGRCTVEALGEVDCESEILESCSALRSEGVTGRRTASAEPAAEPAADKCDCEPCGRTSRSSLVPLAESLLEEPSRRLDNPGASMKPAAGVAPSTADEREGEAEV